MKVARTAEGPHAETERGLAAGLLAMAPLLVAYELAQRLGLPWRNSAERLATSLFEPLGAWAETARLVGVLALCVMAVVMCLRAGRPLVPLIGRQLIQGGLWALVLGPALVFIMVLLDHQVAVQADVDVPDGLEVLGAVSGAAWEELVFRVCAYGVLFLVGRRLALFAGVGERGARWSAELLGLLGSAALFAAFHLELFSGLLGSGGEEFRTASFTFRFAAGILLGALFRWRGPGVSAWSHGLFNLSLALGVAPGVLVH